MMACLTSVACNLFGLLTDTWNLASIRIYGVIDKTKQ